MKRMLSFILLLIVFFSACNSNNNSKISAKSNNNPIDKTAPETTIKTMPDNPSSSKKATFEFVSSEENSTFECSLNGADWKSCSSPSTYLDLPEGNNSFRVRAIDLSGNIDSTPAEFNWIVDTIAPDTFLSDFPSKSTNVTVSTFEFTSSEEDSTFECSLNGSDWDITNGNNDAVIT